MREDINQEEKFAFLYFAIAFSNAGGESEEDFPVLLLFQHAEEKREEEAVRHIVNSGQNAKLNSTYGSGAVEKYLGCKNAKKNPLTG